MGGGLSKEDAWKGAIRANNLDLVKYWYSSMSSADHEVKTKKVPENVYCNEFVGSINRSCWIGIQGIGSLFSCQQN